MTVHDTKESKTVIHKRLRRLSMQFGSSPLMAGSNSGDSAVSGTRSRSRLVIREGSFQQILQDSPLTPSESSLLFRQIDKDRSGSITRDDLDSFISEQHEQDAARALRVKRKSKEAKRKSKEAQSERGGSSSSSSFRHEDQDTAGATSNRKKSKNADKKSVADSEDEISTIPANLSDSASTFEQQHSSSSVARTQLGSIRSIASSGRNHLSLARVGGLLMKFKLVFGFSQCVAFIPITFSLIPWPEVLVNLSHILYMISADVLSMFGNVCKLHTGFYPRFVFQMFLLPTIYLVTSLAYKISPCLCKRGWCKCCAKRAALFTRESTRTRLFEVLFLATTPSTRASPQPSAVQVNIRKWYLERSFNQCRRLVGYAGLPVRDSRVRGSTQALFYVLRRRDATCLRECPPREMHKLPRKRRFAPYTTLLAKAYY